MSRMLRAQASQRGCCRMPASVALTHRPVGPQVAVKLDFNGIGLRYDGLQPNLRFGRDCRANGVAEEDQVTEDDIFVDEGTGILETEVYMESIGSEQVAGAYAFYDSLRTLQFVGISKNIPLQFKEHIQVVPEQLRKYVKVRVLKDVSQATEEKMIAQARVWIDEAGGELPPGNSTEADVWGPPSTSDAESSQSAASSDVKVSPFTKATVHRQVGEAAIDAKEMTVQTVDKALNDIRHYLFADGGDIQVLRVEDGKVYVQFEGACASCSSQETTMTMGVQRALSAAFGDQLKEVVQVEEEGAVTPGGEGREMTVPAVDSLLALLRPAVANYGGKVEVVSVDGGICQIRYSGPDAIWTGVKMAVHDKFGDEVNDVVRLEVEEEAS